jgi:hypothetical protein
MLEGKNQKDRQEVRSSRQRLGSQSAVAGSGDSGR